MKYEVTQDMSTVREYEVEADSPDHAVELVKVGKAKMVESGSSDFYEARESTALGAGIGTSIGAGIGALAGMASMGDIAKLRLAQREATGDTRKRTSL